MENTSAPDFRLFQLEQIAVEALQGADDCVSGKRVDIEKLMQVKYRLQIEAFHGLRSKYDTLGFVMAQEDKVFIDAELMDDDDQERKYRFTLAEELAHYLIHRRVYQDCPTIESRLQKDGDIPEDALDRMEQQAKALAAALLMPKESFDSLVESTVSEMLAAESGINLLGLVQILKTAFDVNGWPIKHRLKHRGFHKRLGLNFDTY